MGRQKRPDFTDRVVHVMNRANEFGQLFDKPDDYAAFVRLLVEVLRNTGLRLIAFCLMPNHWHLLVWPRDAEELPRFMHALTLTHAVRRRTHCGTIGRGHVYKARYTACVVQEEEEHLLRTQRYVERNALTANLVAKAADWPWSSAWQREHGSGLAELLTEGPVPLPSNWHEVLEEPQTPDELEALRRATRAGAPIGDPDWVKRTAKSLGLEHTLRGPGRPRVGPTLDE